MNPASVRSSSTTKIRISEAMVWAERPAPGRVSGFWIVSYLRLDRRSQAEAMTNKARIKIAAGVTALFLAGVCAAGLAVRDGQPQEPTTATARSVATPEPAATPAGGDRGVASVLGAAVAAATGEHGDVASVLDAAV